MGGSSFTNDEEIRKHQEISTIIVISILLDLHIQIHSSSTMFYDLISSWRYDAWISICVCVCHVMTLAGLGVT